MKTMLRILFGLLTWFMFVLCLAPSVWAEEVEINETTFPDSVFRSYVSANCDRDGDGILSESEIARVERLYFNNNGISSLKGIEFFTALSSLQCTNNKLTELDISRNTALTSLSCGGNQLSDLDLSHNAALTSLGCGNNQLSELDLSYNTALTSLVCEGNPLHNLDVSCCTALESLRCMNNQLTGLDLSQNAALTTLYCGKNLLTSLDLSHNTALTSLECRNNLLKTLDLSHNAALTSLDCENNQLASLDISNNTSLITLSCSNNKLTNLDIGNNSALTTLSCYNNKLTSLDLSNITALSTLNCDRNELTSLDLSNNTMLKVFNCGGNHLTSLDVNSNTALTALHCNSNQLRNLDIGKNTVLKTLDCSYNQLSSMGIDISHNIALTELSCGGNQLKRLDLSNNTALTVLNCEDNQLTNLDLSPCSGLWHLVCYSNRIASLDISGCPTLVYLVENLSPYETGDTVRYGGREHGWSSDDRMLYCDKSVTLITDPENAVTISFDKNAPDAEGDMLPQLVNRGEEATLSTCGFTRKGYIFVGWNTTEDDSGTPPYGDAGAITITEPVTLYAQWREGYTITFDKNAADASGNMKPLRVLKGEKITLPNSSFYLSEFVSRGWNTDPDGNGKPYGNRAEFTPTEDMTLYAQWKKRLWVRYYSDDGKSVISTMSAAEGDTVIIRAISSLNYSVPTGMVLDEWNTAADGSGISCKPGETVTLTADLDLYARWREEILTPIDQTRFPDEAFRSYVSTNFDTNGDGILSESEIANVRSINVLSMGISSLKGVEFFTNISLLQCGNNQLTSLDIAMNAELSSLYCQNNQLTNLDVSQNPKLSYLNCGGNELTGLNISNNHALASLICLNNHLSNLDISCTTGLEALQCQRNNLTSLDISKCTSLMQLVSNSGPNTSSGIVRYGPDARGILSFDEGVTLITGTTPDLVLPASLTVIGEEAFAGGAFSYVRLSEAMATIGRRAFADCPNLMYIYIPAATTSIDEYAFANVTGLTVFGKPGSYAESYANAHGYVFTAVS